MAAGRQAVTAAVIARRLWSLIDDFNRRAPRGEQIKIDTNLGRILDNAPEIPRTKRAKRQRPTDDPGVISLKFYADRLGVTVGSILGEVDDVLTNVEREQLLAMGAWLIARARKAEGSIPASSVTTSQTVAEKVNEALALKNGSNVVRMRERTIGRWTPEFPHEPDGFNDKGDTDFPLDFHGVPGPGEEDGPADEDDMPFLSNKDVRDGNVRVVKVRHNVTEQLRAGMMLGVDVTKQNIALIGDGVPAVAYRKDRGTFVGLVFHEPGRTLLMRQDGESIDLAEWEFVGPVVQAWIPKLAKEPKPKGKKGGIS